MNNISNLFQTLFLEENGGPHPNPLFIKRKQFITTNGGYLLEATN